MEIEIEVIGKGKAIAELDSRNPKTADKIYESLPIEANAKIWQEEVYFDIPLKLDYENKSPTSEKGDISYWPPGSAFCIFYGKSQPYSEVNHIGKITENLDLFLEVKDGDKIILRKK
ncbi:MAG: cyclophilin-like fold protein [Methanosarcinales archaeon]